MDYIALLKTLGTLIVVLTALDTVLNVGERFHGYYLKFSKKRLSSRLDTTGQLRLQKKITSTAIRLKSALYGAFKTSEADGFMKKEVLRRPQNSGKPFLKMPEV